MEMNITLEKVLEDLAESDRRKAAIKSVASLLSRFVKEAMRDNESLELAAEEFVFEGGGSDLRVVWYIVPARLGNSIGAPVYVTCGGKETICLSKENIPLDQVRFIYASLESIMNRVCKNFGLGYYFHSLSEASA